MIRLALVLLLVEVLACGGELLEDVAGDAAGAGGRACQPGDVVQQAPNVERICTDAGVWIWQGTPTAVVDGG
jgi:hypothetical protein